MKTTNLIIALIVGILFGYLIRMAVHPRNEAPVTDDFSKYALEKISKEDAHKFYKNYKGKKLEWRKKNRYFNLSDQMLGHINWLKSVHNSDGTVLYFGSSTKDSEEYDMVILARTTGDVADTTYYKASTTEGENGICPTICDIKDPEGEMGIAPEEETEAETPEEKPKTPVE